MLDFNCVHSLISYMQYNFDLRVFVYVCSCVCSFIQVYVSVAHSLFMPPPPSKKHMHTNTASIPLNIMASEVKLTHGGRQLEVTWDVAVQGVRSSCFR